ncbi:MAG TPA: hypothetical protein VMT52_18580 [Planctomycetota bacterium]|nr:hypothetical protein [Planctomycetota bacterium]
MAKTFSVCVLAAFTPVSLLAAIPAPPPGLDLSAAEKGLDTERITKLVAEWQPAPSERKFDQIGWLTEIRGALSLAKEHRRPVFLFTHDGRMAIGRC